jgi:hypothetical protein
LRRSLPGMLAIFVAAALAASAPVAQAEPLAKKPRLSIPLPKLGDFSVGIVRVKAKAKPGKTIPANLKVRLRLATKALAPQVTVAGSVRKINRTTFDVVVAVVNKRTGKPAARALSSAAAPIVSIDAGTTSTNVDLEMIRNLPRARSSLDNILTTAPGVQASWDPAWKGAQADVARGVNVYLDKGLSEENVPREFLELILGIALEISEDGEPDKGQAFDILGEVNELYVQAGDFGCEVTFQRNRFFPDIVDVFVKKCQEPVVEFALVFPEVDIATLQYAPVAMFTPQGGRTDLSCRPLMNAVYGIECPVTGFRTSYDIASGFRGVAAGTTFTIAMCQSEDDIAVFSQRVP